MAVPQQEGSLFKRRVLCQFVDVDSAIGQHASFAVDPADAGICCNNSFETLSSDSSGHSLGSSPSSMRFSESGHRPGPLK